MRPRMFISDLLQYTHLSQTSYILPKGAAANQLPPAAIHQTFTSWETQRSHRAGRISRHLDTLEDLDTSPTSFPRCTIRRCLCARGSFEVYK